MTIYLLESGPVTAYLLGRPAIAQLVEPWVLRGEATTSILVYGEVVEYIKSFTNFAQRLNELRVLMEDIPSYFLNYAVLERFAELRRQLRPPHGSGLIGDIDTLIAATALELDLILVTMDSDFQRVPGLKLMVLPRFP